MIITSDMQMSLSLTKKLKKVSDTVNYFKNKFVLKKDKYYVLNKKP